MLKAKEQTPPVMEKQSTSLKSVAIYDALRRNKNTFITVMALKFLKDAFLLAAISCFPLLVSFSNEALDASLGSLCWMLFSILMTGLLLNRYKNRQKNFRREEMYWLRRKQKKLRILHNRPESTYGQKVRHKIKIAMIDILIRDNYHDLLKPGENYFFEG